jgi:hypothetical protein
MIATASERRSSGCLRPGAEAIGGHQPCAGRTLYCVSNRSPVRSAFIQELGKRVMIPGPGQPIADSCGIDSLAHSRLWLCIK